jgi:aryl-phospho-beta-D-glucosidase BglC (GH1 family)
MKKLIPFYCFFGAALLFTPISCCKPKAADTGPQIRAEEILPTLRGFNLLNMLIRGSSDDRSFNEKDFQTISEWGFNFVRIPMDYRIWVKGNDWNEINEDAIERLDRALEYGMKYNIHVCINFHRAPGYTVATPRENTNLWTDKEPQEAFARMWGYFAERYKNISSEHLSFNLVNEPPNMDEEVYAEVMKKAVDAIRAKDPGRLIIADGREYGTRPSVLIEALGLAQATRGYFPNSVSHYRAEWIEGAADLPPPVWPTVTLSVPRYLFSLTKKDVPRSVYSITHDFDGASYLDLNVAVVSRNARLIVKADGGTIYEKLFVSGAGEGEWTTVVHNEEWGMYQNIYDKDYRIEVPSGTKLLTLEVTDGDWMSVNDMKFTPVSGDGKAFSFTPNSQDWAREIPPVVIDADGVMESAETGAAYLWDAAFIQWEDYIGRGGVIVGEWGAYNKTPHAIVLKWMEDNLAVFHEHGLGWALWNFSGSFGVVNSNRADVVYENYNGYRLDRKMLELLQKYLD